MLGFVLRVIRVRIGVFSVGICIDDDICEDRVFWCFDLFWRLLVSG